MELKIKVKELNHDGLVNFFSTALYGNACFVGNYSDEAREKVVEENDCFEDIMAKILLNGGVVEIIDMYSQEGDQPYSDKAHWDDQIEHFIYTISLDDVLAGINKAAEDKYDKKHVTNFVLEDYDMVDADALLQYVCFSEIVYG